MARWGQAPVTLLGCGSEIAKINRLITNVRNGISGALVIRGEVGIGKSTLLNRAAHRAADLRCLR
ncbi:hypothetical protein AB0L99_26845 [Streptomyces sp. NPDC051954]|uniref:hypothetical protein n=1 Tax=Streptomyces sp. NPDC051954 TaxID=3155524 RepID=UPI003431F749